MKIIFNIAILLFFTRIIFGQNMLTKEEAVRIALKSNYDILISRNNASIDSINDSPGNAGMLPELAITGSDNYYPGDKINQKLSDGTETITSNDHSNSLNTALVLNWTVFDGGRMFVTRSRLKEISELGEIEFRQQVLQTIYDVILAYYDVIRQKQKLASINNVITYNLERVKISQTMFDAGLSPKTGLLEAKIDLNVYRENAIAQLSVITAAKRSLNLVLSRKADFSFEVPDSIPLNYKPDKTDLGQRLDLSNTTIMALQRQVNLSRLNIKDKNSLVFPTIKFNAGYGLFHTINGSGTVLMNNIYRPQIGGTISIPIYQSGNASRQKRIANIQLESAEYGLENTILQVNEELQNALTQYENHQLLLDIEKDNAILAKENLEISIQRLRLGQTTSLEVSLAEENYVESLTRLINFKYNLKSSEATIKQLTSGF